MKTTKKNNKVFNLLLLAIMLPLVFIACANPVTADIERVATNATSGSTGDIVSQTDSGTTSSDNEDSSSAVTVVDIAAPTAPVSVTVDAAAVDASAAQGAAASGTTESETVIAPSVPVVAETTPSNTLVDTVSAVIASSNLKGVSLDGNVLVINTSKGSYQIEITSKKAGKLIKEIRKVIKQERKDKELRKTGKKLIKEIKKELKKARAEKANKNRKASKVKKNKKK